MNADTNTEAPGRSAPPQTTAVKCPSCGGVITLRALGQSVMAACPTCGAHLDVSQPAIRIIKKYQRETLRLHLPLGARGTLRGQTLEVIGAMQRSDKGYRWEEYLLFNPYIGFRWLVLDQGHWSLGQPIKDFSKIGADYRGATYDGRLFRKFHQGSATVEWVVGEFYWRVETGDRVDTTDYVAPPLMLCREKGGGEINYTVLQYLEPAEVGGAFHVNVPEPRGVGANQPSPWARALRAIIPAIIVALVALASVQILTIARARDIDFDVGRYDFADQRKGEERVYGPFTFTASRSLNELSASAALRNSWVELQCSLVNVMTGESFDFVNEISYYSGVDSDGAWSEGSQQNTALITGVPAGTYNLVVEGEAANELGNPITENVYLSLRHDVTPWRNFGLGVLAILLYPAALMLLGYNFDKRRWSESEFNPYSSD
jgi:hypothetical protein